MIKKIKSLIKGRTEAVETKDKTKKVQELLDELKKLQADKIVGITVSIAVESDEVDENGKKILDLETKLVGEPFILLSINRGLQESIMYLLAEQSQGKTLSNMEGVTKH